MVNPFVFTISKAVSEVFQQALIPGSILYFETDLPTMVSQRTKQKTYHTKKGIQSLRHLNNFSFTPHPQHNQPHSQHDKPRPHQSKGGACVSTHHSHLALRQEGEIFFTKLLHLESSTPQRQFHRHPRWFRSDDTMTGGE